MKKVFFVFLALHFYFACGAEPFGEPADTAEPLGEVVQVSASKEPVDELNCVNCFVQKKLLSMKGFGADPEEKNDDEKESKRRRTDSIPPLEVPHTTPILGPILSNIKKIFSDDKPLGNEPFNDQ